MGDSLLDDCNSEVVSLFIISTSETYFAVLLSFLDKLRAIS